MAAALFLGVRYWVLPNIDQWRANIEQQLSESLQTTVNLKHVSAQWTGVNPVIDLDGVEFVDPDGKTVLSLPSIRAELSWRSVFRGSLQFWSIEAQGLELAVRRDQHERLWALGRSFALDDADESLELGLDQPFVQWLSQQRQVVLHDATIAWRDETRSSQPLVLRDVLLNFYTDESGHSLEVRARPNVEVGESFEMRARFERIDASLAPTDPQAWDGTIYLAIAGLAPGAWRPWFDVPSTLASGQVSGQWWLNWRAGLAGRFAAHIDVLDGHWAAKADTMVKARAAQLTVAGPWNEVERLAHSLASKPSGPDENLPEADAVRVASSPGLSFRASFSDSDFQAATLFEHPMQFEQIELDGVLEYIHDHGWQATVAQAHLLNDDMDLYLRGSWNQGSEGSAGIADLQGHFVRALVPAIGRYMPLTVNADTRQWLAKGLVAGELYDVAVVLKGELDYFPYEQASDPGDFWVYGSYRDAIIDYAPTQKDRAGWPGLTAMRGKALLHRVDLQVVADEATVWPTETDSIVLDNIKAQIPNIEHKAVLSVQGNSRAQASAYLGLIRHTPLRTMLDGVLDAAHAQGRWRVPLKLKVPLFDTDETTVAGAVHFAGDSITLWPDLPPFEAVSGVLLFSDTGMEGSNLQARFLGGSASIEGGVGGQHNGLKIRGRVMAEALSDYLEGPATKRFDGHADYQADVRRLASGRYALGVQSDLAGMNIDLPPPFDKGSDTPMPLHVSWTPGEKTDETTLHITLGGELEAILRRDSSLAGASYFHSAALGVGQPPSPLSEGGSIDVRQTRVDLDAWKESLDEFTPSPDKEEELSERPLLPELKTARLQADRISFLDHDFDKATLTIRQTGQRHWRVDVSSTQTAGSMFFQQSNGKIEGKVEARFDRLALGTADSIAQDQDDKISTLADELDIPAINVDVNKFSLYGRAVGHLTVEGVNQQRGQLWRLNKLTLSSPGATLRGTGLWRLSGPDRGLTLDAEVDVSDAGAYLDQIDLENVMEDGKGRLAGQLEWRNMPWEFERSDLNGNVSLVLEDGRFSTLNSRSARLLELLSLQSLQRLARLNLNPATLFKEGFPFDRLSGDLHIQQGVMSTNNYQLLGPVGTISLGGDINLVTEELDLQAMVVPNLDMSGATLAAGLVINPVVGVGAFLTQWLLRGPLSRAMTAHYRVLGNWDDPQLEDRSEAHAKTEGPEPQAAP